MKFDYKVTIPFNKMLKFSYPHYITYDRSTTNRTWEWFIPLERNTSFECARGRTHLETIAFSKFRLFRFTIKRKVLHLQSSLGVC